MQRVESYPGLSFIGCISGDLNGGSIVQRGGNYPNAKSVFHFHEWKERKIKTRVERGALLYVARGAAERTQRLLHTCTQKAKQIL